LSHNKLLLSFCQLACTPELCSPIYRGLGSTGRNVRQLRARLALPALIHYFVQGLDHHVRPVYLDEMALPSRLVPKIGNLAPST
jgi:hypothetical protein